MEVAELRQATARLRVRFAERIDSLDETALNTPSWCPGWLVRDVLAHLVQNAERTYPSLILDLARAGFRPDRAMGNAAKRLRSVPVPELTERLRKGADRHFHLRGTPEGMSVADVLVHGADAFRPLGLDVEASPDDAVAALEALLRAGRMIVHDAPHKGRCLVATDCAWSTGSGPEVSGKALDLVLLVANRRQVVAQLKGPGLVDL